MTNRTMRLAGGVALALAVATGMAAEPAGVAATGSEPAGAPPAEAPGPFLGGFLRETRIVYPLQVGAWRAVDEHLFDQRELGVSIRYENDASPSRLDVYIYPVGRLDEDDFREAAESERRGIALAREQSGDPAPDLGPVQDVTVVLPGERSDEALQAQATRAGVEPKEIDPDILRGHAMDASLVIRGAHWDSAMVLFNHALHFIKGRLSQPAAPPDGRARARADLEAFMAALVPQLAIVNVGQCGHWLPIEPLLPGAGIPEGVTSVTQDDSDSAAYVLPDRILATDPASDQARLAQVLGMAMQGRLPPDCAGVEPINPVVEEGMREIRIEYSPQ